MVTKTSFGKFSNKYVKISYEHILGMELYLNKAKATIASLHHDLMNALEKSGVLKFINKIKNKHGVYKAKLVYEGQPVKNYSTFFPAEWSHEKVFAKICEAYNNFIKSGGKAELQKNGRWLIAGYTKEGIKVKMIFEIEPSYINMITAFPTMN